MELFPRLSCFEWFTSRGGMDKNVQAGMHYYALYGPLRSILRGVSLVRILYVVGEEKREEGLEPLFLIKMTGKIDVRLIFEENKSISFSVNSLKRMILDWEGVFDPDWPCDREEVLFSRNSYNQSKFSFSGILEKESLLERFLVRINNAR